MVVVGDGSNNRWRCKHKPVLQHHEVIVVVVIDIVVVVNFQFVVVVVYKVHKDCRFLLWRQS